jgi:hypothetical protein
MSSSRKLSKKVNKKKKSIFNKKNSKVDYQGFSIFRIKIVSDFIQKITDFNGDEYEYFYEIVQIYEIVQNEIVQNHFGNKKQSLSKKIIDDEFREKFYNKLESFIKKYNLGKVVTLVQKYTVGNKKQGGHTDYPTIAPTRSPFSRSHSLTTQESEILLYSFLPFIIIFVWILFVQNYRGIRRCITRGIEGSHRAITNGIEGSHRAITNGIERMEIFIRRLDFSFLTETVINDENTNDENTNDENLKCTKRESRDSNNHTIIQVSDEINHELDDAIAHVVKPAIVAINQSEQNDDIVEATPEEQNDDTPEEQNDDTVEATPEEKNFLKFMLSFFLFSRRPYDQDFEGQNGGFTPLRIYNAQSVSPRSLLTAHKVGVLNVQRCNKRTIKKKKNKKNKKNTKNNYY